MQDSPSASTAIHRLPNREARAFGARCRLLSLHNVYRQHLSTFFQWKVFHGNTTLRRNTVGVLASTSSIDIALPCASGTYGPAKVSIWSHLILLHLHLKLLMGMQGECKRAWHFGQYCLSLASVRAVVTPMHEVRPAKIDPCRSSS